MVRILLEINKVKTLQLKWQLKRFYLLKNVNIAKIKQIICVMKKYFTNLEKY